MTPSAPRWDLAVVVPAHDEAELIGACLRSVLSSIRVASVAGLVVAERSVVVVVTDSCTDTTSAIASEVLAGAEVRALVVASGSRNAGAARRTGTDAALDLLADLRAQRCWLANTDADTRVPPAWIVRQLQAAGRGAVAVAGIVTVDSFAEHSPQLESRFLDVYELGADGTHPHVHGANLGVRVDAYLAAGGWCPEPVGEDHSLWRRVGELGRPVVSTTRSRVVTSGRRLGRAPGGFADTLVAIDRAHDRPLDGPCAETV